MIKYIIFDMDGVLVDSEEALRNAAMIMFERKGVIVSHEDFLPFTGMGEARAIGGVAEKHGIEFCMEMKDETYAIYGETAEENVKVYDGVNKLMKKLRDENYKLAVASAADDVKVEINLRCIGLSKSDFDTVITGSDVTKHKPDPEGFLMACEKLNGIPNQCVVVEDAIAGCRAAKAAGMSCVGVMTTFDEETLKKAGADFAVEKTNDILSVLKQL